MKEASFYQVSLFLTSIGLFTLVFLWPIIPILHYTKVEVIQEPIPWNFLCASSALGIVFNFAINFGITYTFPLFISLGTILGIPINALVDAVARNVDLANWKITAMVLIVGGFLLMLVPPEESVWLQRKALKIATCYRRTNKEWTKLEGDDSLAGSADSNAKLAQ